MSAATYLKNTELFSELDEDSIQDLAEHATLVTFRRGDVVFHEGDTPDALYVVTSGRVAIANRSFDGRESMVALMEEGALFGEMSLFDRTSGRSTDARALKATTVLRVPFGPVAQIFQQRPQLLWNVVRMLCARLRIADGVLADSVFLDVTGRTAKRLLDLAGDKDEFKLPLTQEELAGMVGASRERVNKSINQFIRLGWMTTTENGYRIIDREQLTIRSR